MSKLQDAYGTGSIKLTKEEIKKYKEFENLTDEELDNCSDFIFQLSIIISDCYENC